MLPDRNQTWAYSFYKGYINTTPAVVELDEDKRIRILSSRFQARYWRRKLKLFYLINGLAFGKEFILLCL